MTADPDPDPGVFDPDAPSAARMWDAASGGWNCNPADTDVVEKILRVCPQAPAMMAVMRRFSARAITTCGLPQVLELGCGLAPGHVLDAAREAGVPVALADSDPAVIAELPVVLGPERAAGLAAARADLRDPDAVLGSAPVRAVIDPSRPVLLLAVGVLHLMPEADAGRAVARWAGVLAPGSRIAVAVPAIPSPEVRRQFAAVWSGASYAATTATLEGWLAGLDLDGAAGPVSRFGLPEDRQMTGPCVLGAIGRLACGCPCRGRCAACGLCRLTGCAPVPQPRRLRVTAALRP